MKQSWKSIPIIATLMIALLVSMSGCIDIEANQKINSDGSSEVELIYDFSGLNESAEMYGSVDDQQDDSMIQTCENFTKNTTWKNAECILEDDIMTLRGDIILNTSYFEVDRSIPYITYRYDATNINNIIEDASIGEEQETVEESMGGMKAMAAMFGIEMTYTLEMPGEIVSSDLGKIKGNTVTIDMFDLMEEEHVYVESRESNTVWNVAIILTIGVVIVIAASIVIYNRKKKIE